MQGTHDTSEKGPRGTEEYEGDHPGQVQGMGGDQQDATPHHDRELAHSEQDLTE